MKVGAESNEFDINFGCSGVSQTLVTIFLNQGREHLWCPVQETGRVLPI